MWERGLELELEMDQRVDAVVVIEHLPSFDEVQSTDVSLDAYRLFQVNLMGCSRGYSAGY